MHRSACRSGQHSRSAARSTGATSSIRCAVAQTQVLESSVLTTQSPPPWASQPGQEEALVWSTKFNSLMRQSLHHEHSYSIKKVEGQLPKGLRGTVLRNGPSLFEVGGKPVPHPFDGDGMVCSLALDGQGGASFANKFVRTEGLVAEQLSGKQLYRSAFNKTLPDNWGVEINLPFIGRIKLGNPLDIRVKNAANTSVLRLGGKTFAMNESGLPHVLTSALETLGTDRMNDTLFNDVLAAHYRQIQECDGTTRTVMFSFKAQGQDAQVSFYEYADDLSLINRSQHTLPGAAMAFMHDVAVTEHYYVLLENPLDLDLFKLLFVVPREQASIAECLSFNPSKPVKLHLVPRPGKGLPEEVRSFEVPGDSFFTFHHANAFEVQSDGSSPATGAPGRYLVLDSWSAEKVDFSMNSETAGDTYYGNTQLRPQPCRMVLDLAAPDKAQAITRSCIVPRASEFPTVAPAVVGRAHTHTYMVASCVQGGDWFGANQTIVKLSTSPLNGVGAAFDSSAVQQAVWYPPHPLHFPSETLFIPRSVATGQSQKSEDDGWLISMVYDATQDKSYVLLLDALDMSEVAKLHLTHHVPPPLHGQFVSEYLGPAPGTPDKKPHDIRKEM